MLYIEQGTLGYLLVCRVLRYMVRKIFTRKFNMIVHILFVSPLMTPRRLPLRGFAKKEKFQKCEITMEVGGWVSLGFFCFFENRSKIALNQYCYFGEVYHVYSVCTYIAKSFGYYDLNVLSMLVMGFQKKVWMGGGWVR